jgi:hypothetical protein
MDKEIVEDHPKCHKPCSVCYLFESPTPQSLARMREQAQEPIPFRAKLPTSIQKLQARRSIPTCGHTDRLVSAKGLCHSCYTQYWRQQKKKEKAG